MVKSARGASALVVLVVSLASALPRNAHAHPLHTTLTELSYATDGGVELRIRAFVDDFTRAVGRLARAREAAGFSRVGSTAAYLAWALRLRGGDGGVVALHPVEMRRQGDVFWIRLRGSAPAGIAGGALRNSLLFDLYDDQVNLVRASYAGRTESLLFTRSQVFRRLP